MMNKTVSFYSLVPVFGISISEQPKIYFNHRNTLISLLSNTLYDETQAATPKAVKAAYDLAKTVSIDEINKKLDKSSVLQTTGNATDKVISQKACDEFYAKKNSWEKFTAGQIDIRSNSNYTRLTLLKGDGNKLLLETAPGDAYFVYRDAENNNKAVVRIPSNKNGTLALTSSTDTFKAGRLNIESATGDTIFNLGGTDGSSGTEFAYVHEFRTGI